MPFRFGEIITCTIHLYEVSIFSLHQYDVLAPVFPIPQKLHTPAALVPAAKKRGKEVMIRSG